MRPRMYHQSMNRTDRLLGILLELQARGETRAEDLARTFEISLRTVYRDVQALAETGVPVVGTPGKGYRLMEGYFLPPLSFTAGEAALLLLGGEYVRERVDAELRQAADDALRKLAGVLPLDRREEVERRRGELLFAGYRQTAEQRRLIELRTAVQERRVLRLLYHTYRRPAPEPREVEPFRLVYLADAWNLAAWCRTRRAPRLFRLDRIDHVERTGERFTLDERHHNQPARDRGWTDYPEARVRFDLDVQRWVRERQPFFFLHEEQAADGPVFVYAARDDRELFGWLLSWGAAAELLAPPDLRARLAREARAIATRHAVADDLHEFPEPSRAPATTVSGASP